LKKLGKKRKLRSVKEKTGLVSQRMAEKPGEFE
jgi:hypothetical protein